MDISLVCFKVSIGIVLNYYSCRRKRSRPAVVVSARCRGRRRFTMPIAPFCCTILYYLLLLLLSCAPLYTRRLARRLFTTSVAKTVLFFFRPFNCHSYNAAAAAADRGVSNSDFVYATAAVVTILCNKSVPIGHNIFYTTDKRRKSIVTGINNLWL